MDPKTRRWFLRTGAVVTAGALAGCGGDGDGDRPTVSGDDYPEVDEWLTETQVGPATDNYDGNVVDWRDMDTVTVDVGAAGNGASFAFDPPGVVVSTGTTVEWEWTGEGGQHNVEAEPDDQIGESDYEFSSGEAVDTTGVQFTQTLDEAGVALYHCEPHLSVGMKGGIAVE